MAQGMKTLTPTLSSGVRPQDTKRIRCPLTTKYTRVNVCVCTRTHTKKM